MEKEPLIFKPHLWADGEFMPYIHVSEQQKIKTVIHTFTKQFLCPGTEPFT